MKKINCKDFFKTHLALWLMFIGIGLVLTLDLLTKEFIVPLLEDGKTIVVIPKFIEFYYVQNTGASFGIFKDKTLVLTIISGIASAGLIVFMILTEKKIKHPLFRVALVLIIGGAVGNLYDRIAFNYVRDFMNFMFIDFPVFNFADNALVIGTILIAIYVIFFYAEPTKKDKSKTESTNPETLTEDKND